MWPTPVLDLPQTDDQEVHDMSETVIIVACCLTIIPSLKDWKEPSSCFALSLPSSCFPPSLPAKLSFLSTEETCLISQSPAVQTLAPTHQACTPFSLAKGRNSLSLLLHRKKRNYGISLLRYQTRSAVCIGKQQNYSWIQNGLDAATAVPRTAVLCAYEACRMWAMSARYFTQSTVAIIVISSNAGHNGEGYSQGPDSLIL